MLYIYSLMNFVNCHYEILTDLFIKLIHIA